ncbi:DUF4132 domain-containing protein [Catenuloplanes sp. NPDC051500]|uniref:DUF4132 domain-containing protein n=1 Tax=Catenuloplanes sp. NPDC051500 TaxID=3363959 RepID=UPI0037934E5F
MPSDRPAAEHAQTNAETAPAARRTLPELVVPDPPRPRTVRVTGLVCGDPDAEAWADGERARWRALAPDSLDVDSFAGWNPPHGARTEREQAVVARFGLEVLPSALRLAARDPDSMGVLLLSFHGPVVAGTVAGWLTHAGSARRWARLWLDRHPETAARALLPVALGLAGPPRDQARRALRTLDRLGHRDTVGTIAAGYGPDAADAVPSLLCDVVNARRRPALIPWVFPEALPQVRLCADGTPLPVEDVRTLLAALEYTRFAGPSEPAPGDYDPCTGRATPADSATAPQPPLADTPGSPVIEAARRICDGHDLALFGEALLDLWVADGMPPQELWALLAQAHLADADTIARLGAAIRSWPGGKRHVRAGDGIAVLGVLAGREWGPDARAALWELHRLTGLRAAIVRDRVPVCLAQAAAAHGLTAAQVPHRTGPVDLGLGADGRLTLDYGPRQVTVGVDERPEAYVIGARSLPRITKHDDPAAVATARARWNRLRRDLRAETVRYATHLENALVTGGRWPAAELGHLVRHPLLGPLSRRLLWAEHHRDRTRMLRVCEDGSLSDLDERTVTLRPDALIGLAHPAEIGADLARWSELFTDYQILQPFPQLGRDRFPLTAAERDATVLAHVIGRQVDPARTRPFGRRGWREEIDLPSGIRRFLRDLPGDLAFVVEMSAGRITDAYLDERGTVHWRRDHHLPLRTLAPAALEEVVRDLTVPV